MAYFANLQSNKDGLIMSNRKGLTEYDLNLLPHEIMSHLLIPSRLDCNGTPPQSLSYLNSRSSVRDFDHCSGLLPRNDPSLEHTI